MNAVRIDTDCSSERRVLAERLSSIPAAPYAFTPPLSWEECNACRRLAALGNRYWLMRHGRARNNLTKLLVSRPDNAEDFPLIEEGRQQAAASFEEALHSGLLDSRTIIFSSDLLRARQTAEIGAAILRTEQAVITVPALRERGMGEFEFRPYSEMSAVMSPVDLSDPLGSVGGVESVGQLVLRMSAVIGELENLLHGRNLVLVSHYDPIRALLAAFSGERPGGAAWNTHIRNALLFEIQDPAAR